MIALFDFDSLVYSASNHFCKDEYINDLQKSGMEPEDIDAHIMHECTNKLYNMELQLYTELERQMNENGMSLSNVYYSFGTMNDNCFRRKMYPEYKGTRTKSYYRRMCKKIISSLMNADHIICDDVYEQMILFMMLLWI